MVVFDRRFTDYKMFASLDRDGIYFVTRQKTNADYRIIKRAKVQRSQGIISNQLIDLQGFYLKKNCPLRLRRIVVQEEMTKKKIVILTNQCRWSAKTIAEVYRDRWQMELFFKAIKKFLKIKRFFGTSRNAVLIQVWTVMIAYLMMSYLKFVTKTTWRFAHLTAVLPIILFQKRDLTELLCYAESPPGSLVTSRSLQLEFL